MSGCGTETVLCDIKYIFGHERKKETVAANEAGEVF